MPFSPPHSARCWRSASSRLYWLNSGSPLISVELRHLGGAMARSGPDHGALATLDGSLCMFAVGMAINADATAALSQQVDRVKAALRPHEAGTYLNFTEQRADADDFFPDATTRRLKQVRAALDPEGLFRANHRIPAA